MTMSKDLTVQNKLFIKDESSYNVAIPSNRIKISNKIDKLKKNLFGVYEKIEWSAVKINREALPIISKIIGLPKTVLYLSANIAASMIITDITYKLDLAWSVKFDEFYRNTVSNLATLAIEDLKESNNNNLLKYYY